MAMRVYEFAKQYGLPTKEVLHLLQEHGYAIKSHMARIDEEAINLLKQYMLEQESESHTQQEEDPSELSPKNTQEQRKEAAEKRKQEHTDKHASTDEADVGKDQRSQAPEGAIIIERKSVGTLAQELHIAPNQLILALLKKGVAATINQTLEPDIVRSVAEEYGYTTVALQELQEEKEKVASQEAAMQEGEYQRRLPIIAVVGHVDHGKTTLLDHIRQTRVTAREKGGITQHLGAYQADTEHGSMVFLDTPGHEAFSIMRKRGVKIADIAILIVAADDGVMPQTIEAIEHAKKSDIPIIVAINKADKVERSQLEQVYQDLARYDLVPEQWGGTTSCIPISAYYGDGVTELLELVHLQADLLELSANMSVSARGYVLESRLEKGFGPVATLIAHHGTLSVGDYFACGDLHGKISALRDFRGKHIDKAGPAEPVLVSGFPELPQAGDIFKVGTQKEVKKGLLETKASQQRVRAPKEDAINLVLKVDCVSSRDALTEAIENLSQRMPQELHIVSAEVGAVTERDVVFANDINARIYGLHTRVESKAATFAQSSGVHVSIFHIIYRLLEDLEHVAYEKQPVKMTTRKIGEATVLKVFRIKNVGVVAGARVTQGYISHDGYLVVWRGKQRIAEGAISSLQHERSTVKEVRKGFECAFYVDKIENWQEHDRVECYREFTATS